MSIKRLLTAAAVVSSSVLVGSTVGSSAKSAARIVSVTTNTPNGTYKVGDEIRIEVNFSEPVDFGGYVSLMLETGPLDRYAYCDLPPTQLTYQALPCKYTVQVGDRSSDLDLQSSFAFIQSNTVKANGVDVDLTLPEPGKPGSLSAAHDIVIDGSGEDEQWQAPPQNSYGVHNVVISEDYRENVSYLVHRSSTGSTYCSSISSGPCAGKSVEFKAVLPYCESAAQNDCIESVKAQRGQAPPKAGEFAQVFPRKGPLEFEGSPTYKLPDGKTNSIFRFVDFPHSDKSDPSADTYAVTVSIGGSIDASGIQGSRSLFASVTPVSISEVVCDERYSGCRDGNESGPGKANGDERGGFRCVMWDGIDGNADGKIHALDPSTGDKSICGLKRAFPRNVRFSITLRTAVEPNGWLHGRMADPEITYEPTPAGSRIVVSAGSVRVPVFAGYATYRAMPKSLQDYYDRLCAEREDCYSPGWSSQDVSTPKERRMMPLTPVYYSTQAFEVIEEWKDFVGDMSPVLPSYWNVRTLSSGEMQKAPECISRGTGVTGVVTTNATAYDEGPPSFDAVTKTMKYKVAAPHFESDGKTEFKGSYQLRVREDIAECLYKFTDSFAAAPKNFVAEEEPFTQAQGAEDFSEATFEEEVDPSQTDAEQFERPRVVDWTVEDLEEADLTKGLEYKTLDDGTVVKVKPYNRLEDGTEVETGEDPVYEPVRPVVASINADVISALQQAASAKTKIKLEDGWFHFSATDFTFSQPTVAVEFGATPSRSIRCVSGASLKVVSGVAPACPTGYATAVTRYCVKGKKVDAVIAAKPKCPKGFKTAKMIRCAKGLNERRVIALSPKCPKAFKPMVTFVCMKGDQARKITSAVTNCASGWAKATTISCAKGKKSQSVTGLKPKCPKGFKKR